MRISGGRRALRWEPQQSRHRMHFYRALNLSLRPGMITKRCASRYWTIFALPTSLDLAFPCCFLFARRGRLFRWAVRPSRLQIQYVLRDIIFETRLTPLNLFSVTVLHTRGNLSDFFFFALLSLLTTYSESIPIMGVSSCAGESHHSTTSSCYLS